jgi:hypothetical protein
MAVLQIHGDGIGAIPSKGDPPIAGNPDRPARFALQRMSEEAGQVDFLWPGCGIQCAQDAAHPRDVSHAQPARIAGLEIPLERPVAETPYHRRKPDAAAGKRQASLDVTTSPAEARLLRLYPQLTQKKVCANPGGR